MNATDPNPDFRVGHVGFRQKAKVIIRRMKSWKLSEDVVRERKRKRRRGK